MKKHMFFTFLLVHKLEHIKSNGKNYFVTTVLGDLKMTILSFDLKTNKSFTTKAITIFHCTIRFRRIFCQWYFNAVKPTINKRIWIRTFSQIEQETKYFFMKSDTKAFILLKNWTNCKCPYLSHVYTFDKVWHGTQTLFFRIWSYNVPLRKYEVYKF